MRHLPALLILLLGFALQPGAVAQKKGPKKKKQEPVSEEARLRDRIVKARERLSRLSSVKDQGSAPLPKLSEGYLVKAESLVSARQNYAADRFISAADAISKALDHLEHAEDTSRADAPEKRELAGHLEKSYFRVQQAAYFQAQSKDNNAKQIASAARRFYQRARQFYDKGDFRRSDELAKSADEAVKALESLAQAAAPSPEPPRLK